MIKRQIIALTIVFSVLLSSSSIASMAASNSSTKIQTIAGQASQILPLLVDGNVSNIGIGSIIPSYVIEADGVMPTDYELYPLLANDEIIAFAQLTQSTNGDNLITYTVDFSAELQQYIENHTGQSFAIIYAEEGIFAINSQEEIECLKNRSTSIKHSIATLSTFNTISNSLTFNQVFSVYNISASVQPYSTQSLQYQTLSVPYVSNASPSCCDNGICWAASIAMIANYYRSTSYTALDIHTTFGCLGRQNGRPGTYEEALHDLGLGVNSATYSNLTFSTMMNLIQGNRIPFLHLDNSDPDEVNHVVVGYGYYWDQSAGSSKYFYFQDPNSGGCIAAFPSSDAVTLSLSGHTYTLDYYIVTYY